MTSLTAARLEVVLAHAAAVSALVVCLQETRHHANSLWIRRHAHNYGWHSAISALSARQGGAAIFWRPCFGRASPVSFLDSTRSEDDHRHVGVRASAFTICSMYGHAQDGPHLPWLGHILSCVSASHLPFFLVGDFHWRPATDLVCRHGWVVSDPFPCTRAILKPLFRVPTSCLAFPIMLRRFSLCPFPALSVLLLPAFVGVHPSSGSALMLCLHSPPPHSSLLTLVGLSYRPTRLSRSGGRVGISVLSFLFARRRPKVSRSFLVRPSGLRGQILHSGPRSLPRVIMLPSPLLCVGCGACIVACLSVSAAIRWLAPARLGCPGLSRIAFCPCSLALFPLALPLMPLIVPSPAFVVRQLLRVLLLGGQVFGGVAGCCPVLKKSLEPPTFTASDMRHDWQAIWCPANAAPEAAAHWREAVWAHAPQASVPTFDAFSSALASASGSAGFDGWEACELKALPKHLPELRTELYQLWCDTMRSEVSAFVQAASSWKTVGLPKRGSGSRPISIGSCLLRAWHRAILSSLFSAAPQGQWACKGGSVLAATAAFLTTPASAVAEIDLAKAFDSTTPLLKLLCSGMACTLMVSGLPSEPIFPTAGSSKVIRLPAYVLAPWSSAPRPSCTAFVDDRTLAITGPSGRQGLLDVLQFTREFDNAVGLTH